MLWTMFKVNNRWPLIIKFAQPLPQLTFFGHPNLPITVEKKLYNIFPQITRYFV